MGVGPDGLRAAWEAQADANDTPDPLDKAMAITRDQRHGASIDAWPDPAGIDAAAVITGEHTPPGLGVALELRMGLKCSRADCGKIIVSDETDRLLKELADQPPDADRWPEGWPTCCGTEMGVPIPTRRYSAPLARWRRR